MVKIRNCALHAPLKADERIKHLQKSIVLSETVYDKGDYGFAHYDLCELNIWIAERFIEIKDYDRAGKYLERGLNHGKLYVELPPVTVHTSFLVCGHRFETVSVYSEFTGNEVKRELDFIDQNERYNEVRSMVKTRLRILLASAG